MRFDCYTTRHKEINPRVKKTTNFTRSANLTKIIRRSELNQPIRNIMQGCISDRGVSFVEIETSRMVLCAISILLGLYDVVNVHGHTCWYHSGKSPYFFCELGFVD